MQDAFHGVIDNANQIKGQLDSANATAVTSKKNLDSAISDASVAKSQLQEVINSASSVKTSLSNVISTANTAKSNLDTSVATDTGSLESKAGWKGLCRKCMTLVFVLVAYRLDLVIGTNYIRDAVIIAFIANETISLVENAGLMGLPLPEVISKAIDILQKNTGSGE